MAAMYIVFCVSWDCVKTKNNFRKNEQFQFISKSAKELTFLKHCSSLISVFYLAVIIVTLLKVG